MPLETSKCAIRRICISQTEILQCKTIPFWILVGFVTFLWDGRPSLAPTCGRCCFIQCDVFVGIRSCFSIVPDCSIVNSIYINLGIASYNTCVRGHNRNLWRISFKKEFAQSTVIINRVVIHFGYTGWNLKFRQIWTMRNGIGPYGLHTTRHIKFCIAFPCCIADQQWHIFIVQHIVLWPHRCISVSHGKGWQFPTFMEKRSLHLCHAFPKRNTFQGSTACKRQTANGCHLIRHHNAL